MLPSANSTLDEPAVSAPTLDAAAPAPRRSRRPGTAPCRRGGCRGRAGSSGVGRPSGRPADRRARARRMDRAAACRSSRSGRPSRSTRPQASTSPICSATKSRAKAIARVEAAHGADLEHERRSPRRPSRAPRTPRRSRPAASRPGRACRPRSPRARRRRGTGRRSRRSPRRASGSASIVVVVAVSAWGWWTAAISREQILGHVADRVELGVARLARGLEMRGLRDRAGAEDADAGGGVRSGRSSATMIAGVHTGRL